jgi:anaerobic glycerol-3-phosphate dehydrogenase
MNNEALKSKSMDVEYVNVNFQQQEMKFDTQEIELPDLKVIRTESNRKSIVARE